MFLAIKRLEEPFLDLNVTRTYPQLSHVVYLAALPDGEAVVSNAIGTGPWENRTDQVLKINSEGKVTLLYSCLDCIITSLLMLGDHLYIINKKGPVIQMDVSYGRILKVYTIPDVKFVIHGGSLYGNPDVIPDKDLLLLCDYDKGEVFTFRLSSQQKQVHLNGLKGPLSVSYLFYDNKTYYVVCEQESNRITVYNSVWIPIRAMGGWGSADGQLKGPTSAIVTPEGNIIVANVGNHRLSEFSFNGTFVGHLLAISDSFQVMYQYSLSFSNPHLWLSYSLFPRKLYRYKLYA